MPTLPRPNGLIRRKLYDVGLWLYDRFCAQGKHLLTPWKSTRTFGRAPHQVTLRARSCILCGAGVTDARDIGA